jgi:hypothetical protein
MSDPNQPGGEIILYQTEDGKTRVQCRFENETVWMTQALMAELFQTTAQNITLHLRAIYAEGELREAATCKDYLQVRTEGRRRVQRVLCHDSQKFRSLRFVDRDGVGERHLVEFAKIIDDLRSRCPSGQ